MEESEIKLKIKLSKEGFQLTINEQTTYASSVSEEIERQVQVAIRDFILNETSPPEVIHIKEWVEDGNPSALVMAAEEESGALVFQELDGDWAGDFSITEGMSEYAKKKAKAFVLKQFNFDKE